MTRLRRLRWWLTVLFTLTTSACLAVLALLVTTIDLRSREAAVDAEANRQATGLSRAVYFLDGVLHLEPLTEDYLSREAHGVRILERTTTGWSTRYEHGNAPSPGTELEPVLQDQDTALLAPHLVGAPVWNGDVIGAVVLVAASDRESLAEHDLLVRWLWIGCGALVVVAAAGGHLLAHLSMRPAVRGLAEQEQFLAEAAHELRTPLATLRLVSREEEVARHVDRMGRLVDGLLTRARVRGGAQEVEHVELFLDQLVEQVVAEIDDTIPVRCERTIVRGDPDLLGQAVRNLVENAVRHGGGARVEVTGHAVVVDDDGPGLGRGGNGGNGIGLAIVRWVAGLHGGVVEIGERETGGVRAVLRLPPPSS